LIKANARLLLLVMPTHIAHLTNTYDGSNNALRLYAWLQLLVKTPNNGMLHRIATSAKILSNSDSCHLSCR
jgi:hypothetical protein